MSFIRQFIGDRRFYRTVLAVAVPMMIQNGITNLVNLLDNVMVGSLSTEAMSGVSIVNQLIFIFQLCTFGMVSGAGLFSAQAFGREDFDGVRYAFRFKLYAGAVLTALATTLFLTLGDPLISLYLHEGGETGDLALTLGFAREYLAIAVLGLAQHAVAARTVALDFQLFLDVAHRYAKQF